jgi:hypothetical protein
LTVLVKPEEHGISHIPNKYEGSFTHNFFQTTKMTIDIDVSDYTNSRFWYFSLINQSSDTTLNLEISITDAEDGDGDDSEEEVD